MSARHAIRTPTKRLLTRAEAAAYCGLGENVFQRECDVRPVYFGNDRRLLRWDLLDLDDWIDRRSGRAVYVDGKDWLKEMP
jgi:hypothetical protein